MARRSGSRYCIPRIRFSRGPQSRHCARLAAISVSQRGEQVTSALRSGAKITEANSREGFWGAQENVEAHYIAVPQQSPFPLTGTKTSPFHEYSDAL
jgi:hypothetical protein